MTSALDAMLDAWIDASEPREVDRRQVELTDRFLMANPAGVERFFQSLRAETDASMTSSQLGNARVDPYPKGYCREISQDVLSRLARGYAPGEDADGAEVFDFIRAGGLVKAIWGDLRGAYFQNAIQLGSLYVDVSNDTVDLTKPKVEILPLSQSGLTPVRTVAHYVDVATRYWDATIYPNTLLPALSPMFPVLVSLRGGLILGPGERPILAHNIKSGFRSAETYIDAAVDRGELLPAGLAQEAVDAIRCRASGVDIGAVCPEISRQELSAAFVSFRSPDGPMRDCDSFLNSIAHMRRFGSVDLLSAGVAINPPESPANLSRIEINSAL